MNRRYGFTLVELLVTIAILGLLLGILMPSLGVARSATLKARCAVNLSSVHKALGVYQSQVASAQGRIVLYPSATGWQQTLIDKAGINREHLICPSAKANVLPHYGLNTKGATKNEIGIVALDFNAESANPDNNLTTPLKDSARHRNTTLNVLYSDGAVQSAKPDAINPTNAAVKTRLWDPPAP
ncbi:MAG: prepilin-type N-terminal cleavage/methylation domain-containing protein [Phycisphaerae bacterium]|nr:prepilin-type N-terminal cleavage/methylation domain-containing protein [Phycisphaerae bacterium]